MIFEVVFFPRAELEIQDIFYWYESKAAGLGRRFLVNFETEVDRIRKNPFQFRISTEDYREVLVHSFPYVIVYNILDDKVLIRSVFNTSRNPNRKP